ncbi:phosphate ABC transporter permease PstA [Salarchaeum japonicum]|uniref:phosphate ABC transporter permease PstA n=1 Tax=Salarchaeum japonicum TaxID=555573 RepID=UPI003C764344
MSSLVQSESSRAEYAAGVGVALGSLALAASVLAFAQVIPATSTVAGVAVADWLAGGLLAGALALAGVGIASRTGALDTTPDATAGLSVVAGFGLLGLATGGLVAAQTLGFSTLWPIGALVGMVIGAVLVASPREDAGLTVAGAGFAGLASLIVLLDVISPGWRWTPIESSAVFTPDTVLPILLGVSGLALAWVSAQAYNGFGARGRERGANFLVGANAAAMIVLLVVIVGLIVVRGFEPMTQSIQYGLYWGPWFWFHVPLLDQYVIFSGPILWFYWPFVMEGVALTNAVNGIAPAIVGTVWLVIGAVLLSVPLGVGTAVFLTEYAEQGRFTQLVEVSTNGLWSTPSIVYGLFGLAFLVPRLGNTNSLLTGMLVLGFMLLPLVVITSREALLNVPDEYRDASAALGVSQWQTIRSVVLPAAMPGVITGVILGVGRIAGETAPILLVMTGEPFPTNGADVLGSFSFTSSFPFVDILNTGALLEPASALPYQLFAAISAGVGQQGEGFAWATALVLLLVVLGFYAIGIASRIYFRKKLEA